MKSLDDKAQKIKEKHNKEIVEQKKKNLKQLEKIKGKKVGDIEKEFDPEVQEYDQMDTTKGEPVDMAPKKKSKTLLWVAISLVAAVAGIMIYMY